MTTFPEFHKYDGLGLAELVRTKQVTPAELVEEAISRIEAYNPKLNAVIRKMYEQARAAAQNSLPNGAFTGVPFLIKDIYSQYEGVPTGCGNRVMKNIPAPHDSEVVRRYKAAGVIILGKTNTPELGLVPYTEPETMGVTHNPWSLDYTVGGSSGGSGAAVAARLVPMAGGGDGGGSLRIPGSCCGVFALKVTRGRTPTGPDYGEVWHGLAQEHVLTRSVRDSAAMLDAIAGVDVGAPYAALPPVRPFLQEVTTEPGRLRIAFTTRTFMGQEVHQDCKKGMEATLRLLQDLGHELVEAAPPIDGEAFALAFLSATLAEARADIEWVARTANRKISHKDFEVASYAMGLLGKAMPASEYANAWRYLQTTAREVGRFFEQYDLFFTPTLAHPPFPIGAFQLSNTQKSILRLIEAVDAGWLLNIANIIRPLAIQLFGTVLAYTPLANVTGQPAITVPLYWNDAGLPIGMQFMARYGDEATLFRLAGQLERAQPWFDHAPAGITQVPA